LKELKGERLQSEKREKQNSLRDEASAASDRMQHVQRMSQSVTLDAVDLAGPAGPGESSQSESAAKEAAAGPGSLAPVAPSDVVKSVASAPAAPAAPAGRMSDSSGINPQSRPERVKLHKSKQTMKDEDTYGYGYNTITYFIILLSSSRIQSHTVRHFKQ